MTKTTDEQLANLDRRQAETSRALAQLRKRQEELCDELRKIQDQRERLELVKLEGKPIALKAGASRCLTPAFRAAIAGGVKLVKVNRTTATVEAAGKRWRAALNIFQDPAAGLAGGMIL